MRLRYPTLLLTCTFVTACGGGTNFNGVDGGPPPAGSGGLVITSANAAMAMSVALGAGLETGGVGDVVGTLGVGTASVGTASVGTASVGTASVGTASVGTASVGNANKLSAGQFDSTSLFGVMQMDPFGPLEQPCLVSGSMTISGDIADPLGLTYAAGDSLRVIANDCVDVPGETVNGQIDYDFVTMVGSILAGPPFEMGVDIVLTNFQIDDGTDVVNSNGGASVTLDTLNDPDWHVSISGLRLIADGMTSSETLSDFSQTQTVNAAAVPTPYTMVTSGSVDSTDLDGLVDYSTPLILEGMDEAYPYAGEFLVSGEDSSIRLIALDEINVRLESDFNGDGIADETTDTTWDALIAQANP